MHNKQNMENIESERLLSGSLKFGCYCQLSLEHVPLKNGNTLQFPYLWRYFPTFKNFVLTVKSYL